MELPLPSFVRRRRHPWKISFPLCVVQYVSLHKHWEGEACGDYDSIKSNFNGQE